AAASRAQVGALGQRIVAGGDGRADAARSRQRARHAGARAGLVAADALLASARLAFGADGAVHPARSLAAGAAQTDVRAAAVGVGGARRQALAVSAADVGVAGLLGPGRADAGAVAPSRQR